jgi:hypothetical protein
MIEMAFINVLQYLDYLTITTAVHPVVSMMMDILQAS